MSLELGCNTLYPEVPRPPAEQFSLEKICEALDNIARLGFDAVEFSHILHLSDEDATRAGEYCRDLGLMPWSGHSSGSGAVQTPEQREQTLRDRGRCLQVCACLGVQVMVYHISSYDAGLYADGPPAELLSQEAEVLRALAAQAEELGLKIAIENGSHVATMQYMVALVDAVDSPALGICIDTGHAALGDLGPARAIRMAGKRLFALHLQDNWGGADHHLPPGCGQIDWCEVAQALADVGYRGVLQLELTDEPLGNRPYHQQLEMHIGASAGRALQRRVRMLAGLD